MNEVPGINIRFIDMRKCDVIDGIAKEADLVLVRNLSTDDTVSTYKIISECNSMIQ